MPPGVKVESTPPRRRSLRRPKTNTGSAFRSVSISATPTPAPANKSKGRPCNQNVNEHDPFAPPNAYARSLPINPGTKRVRGTIPRESEDDESSDSGLDHQIQTKYIKSESQPSIPPTFERRSRKVDSRSYVPPRVDFPILPEGHVLRPNANDPVYRQWWAHRYHIIDCVARKAPIDVWTVAKMRFDKSDEWMAEKMEIFGYLSAEEGPEITPTFLRVSEILLVEERDEMYGGKRPRVPEVYHAASIELTAKQQYLKDLIIAGYPSSKGFVLDIAPDADDIAVVGICHLVNWAMASITGEESQVPKMIHIIENGVSRSARLDDCFRAINSLAGLGHWLADQIDAPSDWDMAEDLAASRPECAAEPLDLNCDPAAYALRRERITAIHKRFNEGSTHPGSYGVDVSANMGVIGLFLKGVGSRLFPPGKELQRILGTLSGLSVETGSEINDFFSWKGLLESVARLNIDVSYARARMGDRFFTRIPGALERLRKLLLIAAVNRKPGFLAVAIAAVAAQVYHEFLQSPEDLAVENEKLLLKMYILMTNAAAAVTYLCHDLEDRVSLGSSTRRKQARRLLLMVQNYQCIHGCQQDVDLDVKSVFNPYASTWVNK